MKLRACLLFGGLPLLLLLASGFMVFQTLEPLPARENVQKLFLAEQTGADIQRIDLTEGDGQHIYWSVSFTRPPAAQLLTQEYGFQADGSGGWHVFWRSAAQPGTGDRR